MPAVHKASFGEAPSSQTRTDGQQQVGDDLPSQAVLKEAADLPVYDVNGKAHAFGSLYNQSDTPHCNLIIFVRHFFCGMCQDYLRNLSNLIPPADLSALWPPVSITIIGCGDFSLISSYATNSNCHNFPIYADPSRKLYDVFGLTTTLDQGTAQPSYQSAGLIGLVTRAVGQMASSGLNGLKGGNVSQVGGEILIEGKKGVVWCHRMRNTRDHTDAPELRRVLGLDG